MNRIFKNALLIALIGIFFAVPLYSIPIAIESSSLDQVTIYDENGQALDTHANAITEIKNGYTLRTKETNLKISTESISALLHSNSILLIISADSRNTELLLVEGAAEISVTSGESPVLIATPSNSFSFFPGGTLALISTSAYEKAYVEGSYAIAYSKITGKRSMIANGYSIDLSTSQQSVAQTTLALFGQEEIKAVNSYTLDFGIGKMNFIINNGEVTAFYPKGYDSSFFSSMMQYAATHSDMNEMGITASWIGKYSMSLSCPYGMTSQVLQAELRRIYTDYSTNVIASRKSSVGFLLGSEIQAEFSQGKAVLHAPSTISSKSLAGFSSFAASKGGKTYHTSFADGTVTVSYAASIPFTQASGFISDTIKAYNQAEFSKSTQNSNQNLKIQMAVPAYKTGKSEGYSYSVSVSNGKALVSFPGSISIDIIREAAGKVFASPRVSSVGQGKAVITFQSLIPDESTCQSITDAIAKAVTNHKNQADKTALEQEKANAEAKLLAQKEEDTRQAWKNTYSKQLQDERASFVAWIPSLQAIDAISNAIGLYSKDQISSSTLQALIEGLSAVEMSENTAKFKLLRDSSILIPDFSPKKLNPVAVDSNEGTVQSADRITISSQQFDVLSADGMLTFGYPLGVSNDTISYALALVGQASGTVLTAVFPESNMVAVSFDKTQYSKDAILSMLEQSLDKVIAATHSINILGQSIPVIIDSGMLIVPYGNLNLSKGNIAQIANALSAHSKLFAVNDYMALDSMIVFSTISGLDPSEIASQFESILKAEYQKMFPQAPALSISKQASSAQAPKLSISLPAEAETESNADTAVSTPESAEEANPATSSTSPSASSVATSKSSSFDFGILIDGSASYKNGFSAAASAMPFIRYNTFSLRLKAFENTLFPFDKDSIRNWYVPSGTDIVTIARYILHFVDEFKIGTPLSTFHLYLGGYEQFNFAPNSFIATMDHDFDRCYADSSPRQALYSSLNTDVFDYTLFVDDVKKTSRPSLWGGLRLAVSPFKSYDFQLGMGTYGSLSNMSLSGLSLYPMLDMGFPIVDKSTFKLNLHATLIHDNVINAPVTSLFKKYMVEGRFSMNIPKASMNLDIAAAYNSQKRFSGMINDTTAVLTGGYFDGANQLDLSSLDIIVKGDVTVAGYLKIFGYLDIPLDPQTWNISQSNVAGLNSDIAMFKLAWDSPSWGISFGYSQMGMTSRLLNLFGTGSKKDAILAFFDRNYTVTTLGGHVKLGFADISLDAGIQGANPFGTITVSLNLSKGSFTK